MGIFLLLVKSNLTDSKHGLNKGSVNYFFLRRDVNLVTAVGFFSPVL